MHSSYACQAGSCPSRSEKVQAPFHIQSVMCLGWRMTGLEGRQKKRPRGSQRRDSRVKTEEVRSFQILFLLVYFLIQGLAQVDLKLADCGVDDYDFLPVPPASTSQVQGLWAYPPPCPVYTLLGMESKTLFTLGKYSVN